MLAIKKEIKTLNGFSILDWVELTRGEVSKLKNALRVLIKEMDFIEYSTFVDFVADNRSPEEFEVACNNTYFFDKYLSSRRHKAVPVEKVSDSISGLLKKANS